VFFRAEFLKLSVEKTARSFLEVLEAHMPYNQPHKCHHYLWVTGHHEWNKVPMVANLLSFLD